MSADAPENPSGRGHREAMHRYPPRRSISVRLLRGAWVIPFPAVGPGPAGSSSARPRNWTGVAEPPIAPIRRRRRPRARLRKPAHGALRPLPARSAGRASFTGSPMTVYSSLCGAPTLPATTLPGGDPDAGGRKAIPAEPCSQAAGGGERVGGTQRFVAPRDPRRCTARRHPSNLLTQPPWDSRPLRRRPQRTH